MNQFVSLPHAAEELKVPYGILLNLATMNKIPFYLPGRKYFVDMELVRRALSELTSSDLVEGFIEAPTVTVEELTTKDIYLAAALLCLGVELTDVTKQFDVFHFVLAGDGVSDMKNDYFNKNIQVDAYTMMSNLKYIKSKMYAL